MLTISNVNTINFFYPTGNTPAVSLTQSLPRGAPSQVLLLGCGDVRHVLFTAHIDPRPLDITACDYQPAIIARNIFLLTLISNDKESSHDKSNWDIYFHFHIDGACLTRLRSHARKLCSLSTSWEAWKRSIYGSQFKFCDHGSFQQVRDMWMLYSNSGNDDESRFEETLRKSKKMRTVLGHADGVNLTGIRSAFPAVGAQVSDLPKINKHYWEHGTTSMLADTGFSARHLNPLFSVTSKNDFLHYGTDPLLGFHLATAYAPLTGDKSRSADSPAVVNAAMAEFTAWVNSYRSSTQKFCMRFFVGDATNFSYLLQNARAGSRNSTPWYRGRTQFEPLALEDEYNRSLAAPTVFDIIDTSNLVDHVGALNLLTAVAPLLKVDIFATLYTERLLNLTSTRQELVDDLAGANLTTMSILLGLVPPEMSTNFSAGFSNDEDVLNVIIRGVGDNEPRVKQQFSRLSWKRPINICKPSVCYATMSKVVFNVEDLAALLHSVYKEMFQTENVLSTMASLMTAATRSADEAAKDMRKRSLPLYHRGSFAAFLHFVKSRVSVDWHATISELLSRIRSDYNYALTNVCMVELCVWLHLLDVYTSKRLVASDANPERSTDVRGLHLWTDLPNVVCVTLEVPRERLAVFVDEEKFLGTPPIHCSIISSATHSPSPSENHFAALQIGFGTISTHGTPLTSQFKIIATEDRNGWSGQSPLLISFYVPSSLLLQGASRTTVDFAIDITPGTVTTFMSRLGMGLSVFKTTIEDSRHVYFSKDLPNMSTRPKIPNFGEDNSNRLYEDRDAKLSLSAAVAAGADKIVSLTSRADLQGNLQEALSGGCEVKSEALSPFNFEIHLGQKQSIMMNFPIPVAQADVKTRIARKSAYIELVATIKTEIPTMPSFMHPLLRNTVGLTLWNLPYISLDMQPALELTRRDLLQWLITHMSLTFSKRQRHLKENESAPASAEERTVVELKDSLFSLFMHFSGLQGEKAEVFGISCPTGGGVNIILFVSALRLDLSNRTVVLDAAVLPLYHELMPRISRSLQALSKPSSRFCQVIANEAEMKLWKTMLPSWAERCRSWSHKAACEYAASGQIPLSSDQGQRCLCSCGEGKFPTDYLRDLSVWKDVSRFAVRVAISPLFHSALVDDPYTTPGTAINACRSCAKEASPGTTLMRCSRCHGVSYCSKDCQRADWKNHKPNCETAAS